MIHVTVEGELREYEDETPLMEAAKEFQKAFDCDILLAMCSGRLQELNRPMREGSQIRFLTGRDKPGMMAYRRSALLLLLRAFYETAGADQMEKISVEFSVGSGLFMEPRGRFQLTEQLVDQVRRRMEEYAAQRLPICKRSVDTDEAIELFHQYRMYDKEQLFRYRRVSRVNLYSLGGFEDYYYGCMVPDAGYIRWFGLQLYEGGLVLCLPEESSPQHIPVFQPRRKLFGVLRESEEWARKLKVPTVGALNGKIVDGGIGDLILIQEALMEKKMGDMADEIASRPDKKFVMVAGPSSSGKTTFARRLSIQLRAKGLTPHPISVDNYFVNRADSPRDEKGNYDYEALECVDLKLFNEDMSKLLKGETVALPTYNFVTGEREYRGEKLTLGPDDILVIEGIHCLNERLSSSLPRENKFKIYISALTQLNVDEHNRIPTTDGRLLRRLVRDARTRGVSAQDTIRTWSLVRRGEESNIFPFQEEADVMFNSVLLYELAVLKPYAEPLLFGVRQNCEEYAEARRLLKFLDYFLGIGSEAIPNNSILREFIGGSCFDV